MNILAASGAGGFLWVLLVLACPLMMIFMMRGMHGGGHGHGGQGHAGHGGAAGGHSCHGTGGDEEEASEQTRSRAMMSLDELKRERDELNALIGDRAEQAATGKR